MTDDLLASPPLPEWSARPPIEETVKLTKATRLGVCYGKDMSFHIFRSMHPEGPLASRHAQRLAALKFFEAEIENVLPVIRAMIRREEEELE